MENTIVIEFDEPINVGKQDYMSILLKEPTVGQLRLSFKEKNEFDMTVRLISLVAEVPMAVIDGMAQSKFKEAADFLGNFGEKDSQKTLENL